MSLSLDTCSNEFPFKTLMILGCCSWKTYCNLGIASEREFYRRNTWPFHYFLYENTNNIEKDVEDEAEIKLHHVDHWRLGSNKNRAQKWRVTKDLKKK